DVAALLVRPAVEVDADVARQLLAQPQRVVVGPLGRERAIDDLVLRAGLVVVATDLVALERILPLLGDRWRILHLACSKGEEDDGPTHGRRLAEIVASGDVRGLT